ncbi:MAG: hypothetical protein WC384_12585 [Prolixibacteraceae bacterium]|jgi:hypothetical protein
MKSKLSLTMVLLILSTMLLSASGTEYTKQYKKGWLKGSVSDLRISNKFGEVKINDMGGDSVTIKVVITVEGQSESKARDVFNNIQISFGKSGGMASAETKFENDFHNKQSFSIDYLINIPKDKNLDINNKYGNVILNELNAKGNFDVSYGSITAGDMKAPSGSPIKLIVSYGKADLESINKANLEFKYSKLYGNEIGSLMLNTKYSTVNLHKTSNITIDSKYDAINIDEVGSLKSESKYTNYKIDVLTENFILDTGYGSVRINKVEPKFEKIQIISSYGGINIGMDNLNYKLQADCDYCDIKYPADRYKGNRIKENHSFSLDGNVGTGGGTVKISSRYGGVKLEE